MPHDFAADNARALVEEIKRAAGEYGKWALEARKKYVDLRLRQDPAIRKLYLRAADRVAAEIRAMGALTVGGMLRKRHLEELEASLRREADRLTGELTDEMKRAIDDAVGAGVGFSQAVTLSLAAKADIDSGRLREIFAHVNRQAVEACWARSRDGLRLSDRIWQKGETARSAIRDIIQESVATGQDAVKTARLLEQYVKTDARTLTRQYPNMMKRMAGRIPGDLSYEALRLARTETTAAFGEGTIAGAQVSPSYQGMKWILSKAHPAPDICDLLATADSGLGPGVYSPGEEPMYPAHPNELCALVPVHEQPEEFVERLKRWRDNPSLEPGLEEWYREIYQQGRTGKLLARKLPLLPGVGARINPEKIKAAYPPDEVISTIKKSGWASFKALKEEYAAHAADWVEGAGIELALKQFVELQELLLQNERAGIYYYVHPTAGAQIAVYSERLKYAGRLFQAVGLVYNINKDERIGFWRISRGLKYFQTKGDFVEIRPIKR